MWDRLIIALLIIGPTAHSRVDRPIEEKQRESEGERKKRSIVEQRIGYSRARARARCQEKVQFFFNIHIFASGN